MAELTWTDGDGRQLLVGGRIETACKAKRTGHVVSLNATSSITVCKAKRTGHVVSLNATSSITVRYDDNGELRAEPPSYVRCAPKQPEAGPVVRDAQRFSFGDVVSNDDNGKEYRVEAALATGRYDVTSLETGRRFNDCQLLNTTLVRHVPSPAKPPGGEVEAGPSAPPKRAYKCGESWDVNGDDCLACGLSAETLAIHGAIHHSSALAEVERQAALVARLEFDLRMLKLLGRGYSRNDLLADLARKSKGGK